MASCLSRVPWYQSSLGGQCIGATNASTIYENVKQLKQIKIHQILKKMYIGCNRVIQKYKQSQ